MCLQGLFLLQSFSKSEPRKILKTQNPDGAPPIEHAAGQLWRRRSASGVNPESEVSTLRAGGLAQAFPTRPHTDLPPTSSRPTEGTCTNG